MANYIVRSCTNVLDTTIISASTLSEGDVVSYYIGETGPFCGTVVTGTSETHSGLYITTYTDCCDCFTGETYNSFRFDSCDSSDVLYVSIDTFCSSYGSSPAYGLVYKIFNTSTLESTCARFVEVSDVTPSAFLELESGTGVYKSCILCISDPPRSANTETFICIPDCEFTGSTAVAPPHPVWTNGYGTEVVQLNMVLIGSGNGLNG